MAKNVEKILSHWHYLIEALQDSPQRVYGAIEEAIRSRNLPDVSVQRVFYREGGLLSPKRSYLRAIRKELIFDVCIAPFGTGLFVSWWLGEPASVLRDFQFLRFLMRPMTYYRYDTALMFQESIHNGVLEVIDQITHANGLRALTESERKPILGDFVNR